MNTSNHIFDVLKDRIIDGRLRPGDPIKERDICSEFEISRTPVREALRRLSAEGFAEDRPRRSSVVATVSRQQLEEVFELGVILESFVAAKAALKATPDNIARLEDALAQMERCLAAPDADPALDYAELDHLFHQELAVAADNKRIENILKQTVSMRLLARAFQGYTHADFNASLEQHRAIVQAVKARQDAWAAAAMEAHIRAAKSLQMDV